MMLQTLSIEKQSLSKASKPHIPEYETYIEEIANKAVQEQTPKQLKIIREKFYELLTKGITCNEIILKLTKCFLAKSSPSVGPRIVEASCLADQRARMGSKDIMHLEALVANFMMIYRQSKV